MLEVPIEQIAEAIRRMDEKERYTLLNLYMSFQPQPSLG